MTGRQKPQETGGAARAALKPPPWIPPESHDATEPSRERRRRSRSEEYIASLTMALEGAETGKGIINMAELTGSEKQIAWAAKIREKALADLKTAVAEAAAAEGISAEEEAAMLAAMTELLLGQTNAGWWIDRRGIAEVMELVDQADLGALMGIGREKALGYSPMGWR